MIASDARLLRVCREMGMTCFSAGSELNALLTAAVNQDASDIFLIPGMPAAFKIHGQIEPIDERKILPGEIF